MEHRFEPIKYYFTYGTNEHAYRVRPGDIIVAPTLDAAGRDSNGHPIPDEARQKIPGTILSPSNPLTGPFYIEGAEPGDALIVKVERIDLNRSTAYSAIRPHFASFTEEDAGRRLLLNEPLEERYYQWQLDLERKIAILEMSKSRLKRVQIPLHPFIGSIGVAPKFGKVETADTPGDYGGNMDCIETAEGSTLYFPVFTQGAYLAFGDVHAAQGDGEICGVALETTALITLRLDIAKSKAIEWPRFEDPEWIMVAGSSRSLIEAFKIAHYELLEWLVMEYGFDKWEAFQLLSQIGRCRVGNVVDPLFTVVAKFPKRFLP